MIGRRIRWADDPNIGTIIGVAMAGNGDVRWIVKWEPVAPTRFGECISPDCGVDVLP